MLFTYICTYLFTYLQNIPTFLRMSECCYCFKFSMIANSRGTSGKGGSFAFTPWNQRLTRICVSETAFSNSSGSSRFALGSLYDPKRENLRDVPQHIHSLIFARARFQVANTRSFYFLRFSMIASSSGTSGKGEYLISEYARIKDFTKFIVF